MPELALLFSGFVIATLAMGIGIGGGILWTPLLLVGFGLTPQEAITTSLMIQVVGLSSGTLAYLRSGLVVSRLSLLFALVAIPGVLLGSFLTLNLPKAWVQMALGVMALTLALSFVAGRDDRDEQVSEQFQFKTVRPLLPIPAVFGLLMGLLSTGIGEWLIPALRTQLKLSMQQAVATVIPTMLLLALTGSMSYGFLGGEVAWSIALWGSFGTLLGGQVGPLVARRIDERLLKNSFIYLMTLTGVHLIFQAI